MNIEDRPDWPERLDSMEACAYDSDCSNTILAFIRLARKVPKLDALYEREHALVLILDARIDILRSERDAAQEAVRLLNCMVKCGEDHSEVSTAMVRKGLHCD